MSFARHNRGRPLFSQADIVSARERALLAENRQLRDRNTRLKDAMLTLVERIETQLPSLKENAAAFEQSYSSNSRQNKATEQAYRERSRRYRYPKPPKMEVYETFEEPIEFGDPAPEMRFGKKAPPRPEKPTATSTSGSEPYSADFVISPELAPEEIDILKSPTRNRPHRQRETVDVVDLHPASYGGTETERAEHYEAGASSQSEIPAFEFPEEEDVIDIDFERRETLRAAMRRRVNRLRW
ncbi:hypothetical protein [Sneathiella litorea]|uniref:Uncharacterized protein n=1 Tax=Sneathiella litorea TaxID=2606216 RepID=A0A6L8W4E2_9PROT|nr:hypothetical protein [Sneathiella litorea]MZR29300.1 hypothetical protein [Sneathiella litorea]